MEVDVFYFMKVLMNVGLRDFDVTKGGSYEYS